MSLKHQPVGRLGLIFGICILGTACVGGEIGNSTGVSGFDPGSSNPGDQNDGFGDLNGPQVAGEESPLVCPGANADLSASSGWRSSEASQPASGALRFDLKARPTAADLNGLVAVGTEDINTFSKAAIAVRFADDGFVDARDGGIYDSDVSYPYDPGVWYNITVTADVQSETYDVEIGPCGEAKQKLIENASFRDDASVSEQLSGWGVWSSQSAALEVSTPAWMASGGCAPSTCETLGNVCGQPSDGCGGVLSCGTCGSGETCSSGACVDVSTPPPPCQPATCQTLNAECGQQSNGCGGLLSCGDCSTGQMCSGGSCIQEPAPPPACEPATCQTLSAECGLQSDGCGGTLSCGGCISGQMCSTGICVNEPAPPPPCQPATCQTLSAECGAQSDGCGGTVSCGTCNAGDVCTSGTCSSPGVTGVPYGHVTPADVGVTIGVGVVGPVPTEQYTGSCTPAAGTTIENVVINNCSRINIYNPNITLRNVIANVSNTSFAIYLNGRGGDDASNFTVEHSQINQLSSDGKVFGSFSSGPSNPGKYRNWTIRNSEITGGYDFHFIEGDLDGFLVENNYYHDLSADPTSGVHADGFQISEANHTTGQMTIRGNYFEPDNTVSKTALLFSTGDDSFNQTHILWESNFIPIWGAYTVWCHDSDSCTVRYNVYRQDFRSKLGNRSSDTGRESDGYPNCAYRVSSSNAPFTAYRCNRYEDGGFIESEWVCVEGGSTLTHDTSGCPSYP